MLTPTFERAADRPDTLILQSHSTDATPLAKAGFRSNPSSHVRVFRSCWSSVLLTLAITTSQAPIRIGERQVGSSPRGDGSTRQRTHQKNPPNMSKADARRQSICSRFRVTRLKCLYHKSTSESDRILSLFRQSRSRMFSAF